MGGGLTVSEIKEETRGSLKTTHYSTRNLFVVVRGSRVMGSTTKLPVKIQYDHVRVWCVYARMTHSRGMRLPHCVPLLSLHSPR